MSSPNTKVIDNVVKEEPPTIANNSETVNVDLVRVEQPQNVFQKKKRKRTSLVWDEFDEEILPDGTRNATCHWCKKKLLLNNKGSTTHLIRHLKICTRKQLFDKKQKRLEANTTSEGPVISAANFVYNHAKVREVAAQMVLVHEYPFRHMEHEMFNIFLKIISPYYQKISRTTSKNNCMTVYELEKKRLKALLKTIKRVSITIDCWKSGQDVEYMVIMGHFVDDWKLHKQILNFVHVPPPCFGVVISNAIYKCLVDWVIKDKVATITVDNTTYNVVAVRNLQENINLRKKLVCGGMLFHVRCTAHIINLLVQDGLKEIQHIIKNSFKEINFGLLDSLEFDL